MAIETSGIIQREDYPEVANKIKAAIRLNLGDKRQWQVQFASIYYPEAKGDDFYHIKYRIENALSGRAYKSAIQKPFLLLQLQEYAERLAKIKTVEALSDMAKELLLKGRGSKNFTIKTAGIILNIREEMGEAPAEPLNVEDNGE